MNNALPRDQCGDQKTPEELYNAIWGNAPTPQAIASAPASQDTSAIATCDP